MAAKLACKETVILTDDEEPVTRNVFENAFSWALSGYPSSEYARSRNYRGKELAKNTLLYIFVAGHGSSVMDLDGDEIDGKDEVYVCSDGLIYDDWIRKMLQNVPSGVTVVLMFDCCSSGTICDLGFVCNLQNNRVVTRKGVVLSPANKISADVLCLSACNDGSVTFENEVGGLFTTALLGIVKRGKLKIVDIFNNMPDMKHQMIISTNKVTKFGNLVVTV